MTDYSNNRIEEFSPNGEFIRACGSSGSGEGQFAGPTGIAINPSGGVLFVSDSGNDRIQQWGQECTFLGNIGKAGSGSGDLSSPGGLAFSTTGPRDRELLLVADSGNNRIAEFELTKLGEAIPSYGAKGSGSGQFNDPTDIALAGKTSENTDEFYVVDSSNNRIVEFSEKGLGTKEEVKYTWLREFGSNGTGNGLFSNPTAIVVDPSTSDLYITDTGNNRVETFLPHGEAYVTQFGVKGVGNEDFEGPKGISASSTGNLYIADSLNDRVDTWQPSQTANSEWHLSTTPNPSEAEGSFLDGGVSCTSFTVCTAIGEYNKKDGIRLALAERWNGAEWSVQPTPNPTGAQGTHLRGISCSSPLACVATGYYLSSTSVYLTVAESWNGTEWKITPTPEPPGTKESLLYGVSCSSSSACTAVGWDEGSAGVELPWAERWNGTTWSVQSMPTPTGAKASHPTGVSCRSSIACTVAGYYTNSAGIVAPFAERWNGTEWSVQTMPEPSGSSKASVTALSCSSSAACTAVGYYNSAGIEVPFAERWNGTEWSVQTMPEPSGTKNTYLRGVSCASSTACVAVGYYVNSSSEEATLAERWNGTAWSLQTTPNPAGSTASYLNGGVSCSSNTECAAVGYAKGLTTLAEIYG